MAEVFGTMVRAVSVATLFNNCVDSFEYIQLGRHFGRDFDQCQLKIDIARIRLNRWGQAVAINIDPRFATDTPRDALSKEVFAILEEIQLLFQSLQKASKRYEIKAKPGDLERFHEEDMQPVARGLHDQLKAAAPFRQKNTSSLNKAALALYDMKSFDNLLRNITRFVDDLEKLCPVETRMVKLDIEEVDDEPSLLALQLAAVDTDPVLSEAATQKIESISGKNYIRDLKSDDTAKARVHVGNEWHEAVLSRGTSVADRTTNTVDVVTLKGTSRVHVGHKYGGRGVFDD